MELKITNSNESIQLSDEVFACEFRESLVHQIVTAYMAAGRAGTKAQKTRAEVSGGGAKPFRQKGTGRARAGTIRSPIWRKGGVVFAAKPRSFKQKVNKKMFQGALRSILSELIRQDRLIIVDDFILQDHKTKTLLSKLAELNAIDDVLIITEAFDQNLYLASRNLYYVDVRDSVSAASDPVALIRVDKVIMSKVALRQIEDLLK